MDRHTNELAQILDEIVHKLSTLDNDVVWSHYDNQAHALADIKRHIEILQENDYSKLQDLKVLFAPTGSLQEIAISSGWGDEFLVIATQFDKAIENY